MICVFVIGSIVTTYRWGLCCDKQTLPRSWSHCNGEQARLRCRRNQSVIPVAAGAL
ncbi:hypothetical protein BC827DRAFT_1186242 [Russula dissimulans]|nr:hypothetical protein BC827DRAFT_1186242 [Russula dissimulans]